MRLTTLAGLTNALLTGNVLAAPATAPVISLCWRESPILCVSDTTFAICNSKGIAGVTQALAAGDRRCVGKAGGPPAW